MTRLSGVLLGAAAGLVVMTGAQAADLPLAKAAPVNYVRVCDWTGAGYFYIPGTDTCIKIGGYLRAEYAFIEPARTFVPSTNTVVPGRARAASGFRMRGRIDVDTRTQTAYGVLRAYARIQSDRLDGNYTNSGTGNGGALSGNNTYLDTGFIQFAGITAGRVQSLFDFYADYYNYEGIATSDYKNETFAYTATFGGGFSATVGVEDKTNRSDGIRVVNPTGRTFAGASYGGERLPDAIGVLRLDQAWGALQLSAAYHQVNTVSGSVQGGTYQRDDEDGFAVQGGVRIKLPMLAAGDDIWLQGAYQQGAYRYQDSAGNMSSGFNGSLLGGFIHQDADAIAIVNPNGTYTVHKGEGFSVLGALHHYFTPQFHDVLFGSYEETWYGAVAANTPWFRGGLGDASSYRIGNQFIFTPVSKLDIGVEVLYAKLNQDIAGGAAAAARIPVGIQRNPDTFEARLRMERDF